MKYSSSLTLTDCPPKDGIKISSPALTEVGITLPSLLATPGPAAITVPWDNFGKFFSGK